MKATGKSLSQLAEEHVKRFPKVETSVRVNNKPPIENTPYKKLVDQVSKLVETELNGRVVVRYSGTEPKLRIMVEGEHEDKVKYYADVLKEKALQYLG